MIQAEEFVLPALGRGYSFWTGVPCSFLTPFINYVLQAPGLSYIGAASEGEAVGIAAGAYMAGRKTVVICQNSGLGNTVNPLTSLNHPFRIPTLLIATLRGAPGTQDEPQHELMGRITQSLLDLMEIKWEAFPDESSRIGSALERADRAISVGCSYAFVMAKGAIAECALQKGTRGSAVNATNIHGMFFRPPEARLSRMDAVRVVWRSSDPDMDATVATTGKIGRELFSLGHRTNQLYLVGSMGCASAVALGIHEASHRKRVLVLDGDGAVLMKAGTLSTIGHRRCERLIHIVLDNEAYESTGGQATSSSTVDFCALAAGCGYSNAWHVDGTGELENALEMAKQLTGPNLIHVKVRIEDKCHLGRPTVSPESVKHQFMDWLAR